MFLQKKHLTMTLVLSCIVWTASNSFAQQPGPRGPDGPPHGPDGPGMREGGGRGPGGPHLQLGPPGRWWNDADIAKRVGLSPEQVKKMDDIFTANRLKLIDRFAAVQKEETIMEPLVSAEPPDENKLLAQIDKVAQARAELEKANARMLLELRGQLSHDQWLKLQSERPPMHRGGQMRGGPGGGHMEGGMPGPPPPPEDGGGKPQE
ncbi:MAG TPA: periplasmic heavy metal sensor [Terriglobales bacterium]|jgi:Spy/CpxP family protein refolding chaperone|nr:periplasmic heavy metal sensor [Terriglobales bacterium]